MSVVLAGMVSVLWVTSAAASIDATCADLPKPADYDEQVQRDRLSNVLPLVTAAPLLHGAVAHQPGRGGIGVEGGIVPTLGCEDRFVLDHTKTEDTNQTPVLGKLWLGFGLPTPLAPLVPYGGVAFLPPVRVLGTQTFLLSGELGVGVPLGLGFEVGLRGHATTAWSVADFAHKLTEDEPDVDDLGLGHTLGVDAVLSYELARCAERFRATPFLGLGWLDAHSFTWIGDDGAWVNNLHPYSGPELALGVDALIVDHLRAAAEGFVAPGGYSLPDESVPSVPEASRYGHLATARFRIAWEPPLRWRSRNRR